MGCFGVLSPQRRMSTGAASVRRVGPDYRLHAANDGAKPNAVLAHCRTSSSPRFGGTRRRPPCIRNAADRLGHCNDGGHYRTGSGIACKQCLVRIGNRAPNCNWRGFPTVLVIEPTCALPMFWLGSPNCGWFGRLNASARISNLVSSPKTNALKSDASQLVRPGPYRLLRAALP